MVAEVGICKPLSGSINPLEAMNTKNGAGGDPGFRAGCLSVRNGRVFESLIVVSSSNTTTMGDIGDNVSTSHMLRG